MFIAVLALRAAGIRFGLLYALLATALWVALLKSGVDPVLAGLAMGLITYAYPASRSDLERASDLFRLFREQPTPELARSARVGLAVGDLAQRAAAAGLPSLDELRDRAPVRARQRRHPAFGAASWDAPSRRR